MEFIPENKLLESNPDTLQAVRKEVGLDKPGEMKAAVNILKEWIQQQPHFKKTDFSEHLLEMTIIVAKGSMERAKRQIDKVCTVRSLWPHFFHVQDIRSEFADVIGVSSIAVMPKLTEEHHRIIVVTIDKPMTSSAYLLQHYKLAVCIAEYLIAHDYVNSYQYVLDLRQANMANFLTSFNLTNFRQIFAILVDCYGMRLKGIHMISNSKLIETFIGILKQFLKPKLMARLRQHGDAGGVRAALGEAGLPRELGGAGRSARDIQEDWIEELSSKQNMAYLREMGAAGTDEGRRAAGGFAQEYAGLPGTFRLLAVD